MSSAASTSSGLGLLSAAVKQVRTAVAAPTRIPGFRSPRSFRNAPIHVGTNMAFVFLKPHAITAEAVCSVKKLLAEAGVNVMKEGTLSAAEIEAGGFVDTHYRGVAAKALSQSPSQLVVTEQAQAAFAEAFGLSWPDAMARGLVCNAMQAMQRLGCTAGELDDLWTPLQMGNGKVKFGGGFYCGRIRGLYVINGFYMNMRAMYTQPQSSIHWFVVDWNSEALSWVDFRGRIIGDTDPSRAAGSSLRGHFFRHWQELGLAHEPHTGENAVHASASPMEALAERRNWLQLELFDDPFGRLLLDKGVRISELQSWVSDPVVEHRGVRQSLFDLLENLDTKDCLARASELARPLHS
eukprot:CAMPEP_0171097688 /NCGR_PEP_ID=MMETSP0766_2-20121228/47692_1 /TAXON_ID=439317 /ORGANISM="Gambierdiscus australes, Strain CAWD 149" /LENGTH=351 /DNA_ID=CAMNT_0011556923 /DNA_START=269 /DNA_END=1324 /DNA_ORIENTATION=+